MVLLRGLGLRGLTFTSWARTGPPELGPWRVRGFLGLEWGGSKTCLGWFWLGRGMGQGESLEGLKVHRLASVLWERPTPLKHDPQTKNPGPQK